MFSEEFNTESFWTVGEELGSDVLDVGKEPGKPNSLIVTFYPPAREPMTIRFWGINERGLTEVLGWPNRNQVCVVAAGVAYLGDPSDQNSWLELEPTPIQGALCFPKSGQVVPYDRWRLYGYGSQGHLWTTQDVAIDGFEISHVGEDSIETTTWLDREDSRIARVDVRTGAVSDA